MQENEQVKVEFNDTGEQKSVANIKHVLQTEFTSPKQAYNEIIQDPQNITEINGKKALIASYGSKLYQYVEDLYQPYFTDSGFKRFFVTYAFRYTLHSNDIQINVDNISIKRSQGQEEVYNFVVEVNYKKRGDSEKKYQIKGVASIPENGKIEKISYVNDGGLLTKIQKNS